MADELGRQPFVLPPPVRHGPWNEHGPDPWFWQERERALQQHFEGLRRRGSDEWLHVVRTPDLFVLEITSMNVPGDSVRHDVTIEFHRDPPYDTYGLPAEDFPRARTTDRRPKLHAYPAPTTSEGPLCLWFPKDPEERRWTSRQPLANLVEVIRSHLFLEHQYRRRGTWLAEDAPHGFPETP